MHLKYDIKDRTQRLRGEMTNVIENFNATTINPGGNQQGLEQGCLLGTYVRDLGRDVNVDGGDGSSLGRSFDLDQTDSRGRQMK